MILNLPKVLNASQLAELTAVLNREDAPWVDGRATAGHQGAAVKRNQQLEEASSLARELGNKVLAALEANALFVSAVLPNRVYPPMFNRYGEGMQFGTHIDGAIRTNRSTGQQMRTDLSATLFIAPKDSYEGGELILESDLGSQSIKLDAGDLLVYPAASRHQVTPVTRGARLACVFWVQSLVRDDLKRSQLFELDRTIQRLTRTGADPDSLVRLTGLYHSLLRIWSET